METGARQRSQDKDAGREYVFDLGGQFPVDRLRFSCRRPIASLRSKVLARTRASDAWRRVAVSTRLPAGRGRSGGGESGPAVSLTVTDRYWLLRVDQRGGGLGAGTLALAAGWLPQRLVFAARGAAPFQLAYGSSRAAPAAYPIATLVPGYRAEDDGKAAAFPIGRCEHGCPDAGRRQRDCASRSTGSAGPCGEACCSAWCCSDGWRCGSRGRSRGRSLSGPATSRARTATDLPRRYAESDPVRPDRDPQHPPDDSPRWRCHRFACRCGASPRAEASPVCRNSLQLPQSANGSPRQILE
jgi:hypothetical protein